MYGAMTTAEVFNGEEEEDNPLIKDVDTGPTPMKRAIHFKQHVST